ncbi:MAG: elongation factor P [Candidatus Marinimicrobia bacterium]|nr:elongation factor P [Candidatus Neomarinimicrobiota bacterium]
MYTASDLRKGLKIEIEGAPCIITDFQFVKPGKGQALYRCRIKNLFTGASVERTFRSVDKIDQPNVEERDLVYSYAEGDHYVFMDPKTYEQVTLGADVLGTARLLLTEDLPVRVVFFNDRAFEVSLPNFVEKRVVTTEPGARGDTATNVMKPAIVEGGYELPVPLFINEGDLIRIDTRDGKYDGRIN